MLGMPRAVDITAAAPSTRTDLTRVPSLRHVANVEHVTGTRGHRHEARHRTWGTYCGQDVEHVAGARGHPHDVTRN